MTLEERIRHLRRRPVPPNERSAQAQVIGPILAHLGWPSDDPACVLFEHPSGKGRIDIALRLGDRQVAFLETKAPGLDLGGHVDQVLRYAFYEGVDICVLTTGLEWWFYLPREKGPPEDRRFAVLRIDEGGGSARECADVLRRYLGRDALGSRSAERSAKEALRELRRMQRLEEEVPKVWAGMKKGDDELLELIAKRVKERSGLDTTPGEVASVLRMSGPKPKRKSPPQPPESPHQPSRRKSPPTQRKSPPTRRKSPPSRLTSFRLWGRETSVETWAALLVGVYEAVLDRHGDRFLDAARPLWGKWKPWVSADPDEMLAARPIGQSGLHVETNLSAKEVRRRCRDLLEAFGHSASDLEIR